jgi:sugar-specific transcriptional regulator TrmB
MLTIRDVQMRGLDVTMRESFLRGLQDSLVLTLPVLTESLGSDELQQRIATAFDRAAERGIRQQSSAAVFVRLSLSIGPRFDELPAVLAILSGDDGTADERMLRLATDVPPEAWAAAAHDAHVFPWDAVDAARREG